VRGAAGEHLAALVDPRLPAACNYLWWVAPTFGKHEFTDALRICDSLVIDSSPLRHRSIIHGADPAGRELTQKLGVADLQWART